ncbi:3'(2'),5'-bisphosphate nucleotidase CysQ [Segnochrobactrum spirostomi]|uniref:3'(2'),5'-bisphosphate nucleotidase CysQ n=1 Tax=Segnochrobactrum spirostomi TaxID=2608987 RepID=A0A6A7Y0R7_9HYPH|nr:3'(2'),5'-bisphosphate nucleotidase CysQ [Segnochrobactrum spirostomi]MQT11539.1 3'(2'),5'-bisphosphate nucleotidase CysQ [Segnochrobactrum spirostomi]
MLDGLVALALAAGTEILAIYGSAIEASDKADGSPVTAADVRAEAVIAEGLARLAPDIPVVAEEATAAGRVPATHGKFFLVDPLDGTREFLSRNGEFTVNIALVEAGRPVLGVVYAPALGEIFIGAEGEGARAGTLDDRGDIAWTDITVREPDAAGLDVLASRSHLTAETKDFIDRFKVRDLVSAGSSLKFCRLAAGDADLYPRLGRTMEWDTAAGDAVLRAAGGRTLTLDGAALLYGKRNQASDSDFANPWFVAAGLFDPLRVGAAATV